MKNESMTPIFLHGMWRCGSTYVWSLFRGQDDTYCYYEPLYQGLARLTPERIYRADSQLLSLSSHPNLEKPYFYEYGPLIKRRGVEKFKAGFAYERAVLEAGDTHRVLKAYLAHLNEYAHQQNKTPVLGFNRTSFRLSWVKENFGGRHIYIDRDPVALWRSYEGQRAVQNYTFFGSWVRVIEASQDHPFMAALVRELGLRGPIARYFGKPKAWQAKICERLSQEQTYFMVFCLWAMSLLQGLSAADEIFDMSRAGRSDYNAERSKQIFDLTGLVVSFADAQSYEFDGAKGPIDFESVEARAIAFMKAQARWPYWDKDKVLSRAGELAPRKREIIIALCG